MAGILVSETDGLTLATAPTLIDTLPRPFDAEPITDAEAAALFRAALSLFALWQVIDEQAAVLLDMAAGGVCAALFHPDLAAHAVQGRHLDYHRDGRRVDLYRDAGSQQVYHVG